jgi:CHAD domain-containing protein
VDAPEAVQTLTESAEPVLDRLEPVRVRALSLVDDARAARKHLAEVHESGAEDAEAIHDFRVALRRLRSALRPLGIAWGKKKMEAFGERLRAVADTTGELRDEEVLRETLGDLELEADNRARLASWQTGRARRERGLRARVVTAILGSDELDGILDDIRARVEAPAKHDFSPESLAREALSRALKKVHERAASVDTRDKLAMHKLRIAAKRIRYSGELFDGLYDADFAKLAKAGAKLQKRLGTLHDLDEARIRMGRAYGLDREARHRVLDAIDVERERIRKKSEDEIAPEIHALEKALGH